MQNGKILCIGAIMADVMSHVPALPQRGEGVVVAHTSVQVGGCAFNSANAIRQLGAPHRLFAPLGQGIYARFIRDELAARGLTGLEVETTLDCGSCLCLVEPDGERTMVTSPGIERRFESEWFNLIDPADFSIAFASGYEIDGEGGNAIIGFLEANPHIEFWYAPGPRTTYVSDEKMARIKALRPCWHLNDLELLQYAEKHGLIGCAERHEAAKREVVSRSECTGARGEATKKAESQGESSSPANERVLAAGAALACAYESTVVVTMGAQGAAAFFPDGTRVFAETDAVTPVDTVGAGDTHLGALVAARHAGYDWPHALKLANHMAAAVCQHHGGTIPDEAFAALGVRL